MNSSILATISRAEAVLAALRRLAAEPAAQPFHFSGAEFDTTLLQFFPDGPRGEGCVPLAKRFARLLGGTWTADGDKWECRNVTYQGLEGTKVFIYYVLPKAKVPDEVDLSEPEPEPVAVGRDDPKDAERIEEMMSECPELTEADARRLGEWRERRKVADSIAA